MLECGILRTVSDDVTRYTRSHVENTTGPIVQTNSGVDEKRPPHSHTILWADDDADDRHVIIKFINSISSWIPIYEAGNGLEVLRYLHAITNPDQLPCLVVLDINMPRLSGTETLVKLKNDKRFKSLAVAVFTTSAK